MTNHAKTMQSLDDKIREANVRIKASEKANQDLIRRSNEIIELNRKICKEYGINRE